MCAPSSPRRRQGEWYYYAEPLPRPGRPPRTDYPVPVRKYDDYYALRPSDVAAAIARALAAANDRPNPGFDPGCSPQRYAALAQSFRSSAWQHLDEGDLPQASNKGWGLVAETVKAVSAHHGGIIHTHRGLWMVVHDLARLVGDAGDMATRRWINVSFAVARSLHFNYYDDRDSKDEVLDGLTQCEELSQRLYELFWPGGLPAPAGPPQ